MPKSSKQISILMDKDCRTQWDNFVRESPGVDDDYDAFIIWSKNLVAESANFESYLHERYETACQGVAGILTLTSALLIGK
jgi:hypothetical protein